MTAPASTWHRCRYGVRGGDEGWRAPCSPARSSRPATRGSPPPRWAWTRTARPAPPRCTSRSGSHRGRRSPPGASRWRTDDAGGSAAGGEHAVADLIVVVDDPLGHPLPAELRRPLAPRLAHVVAQFRVAGQRVERRGEGAWIARLDEEPLDVALHDPLEAVDVRGDDRHARGHRLEQHDPERLLACVRGAVDVGAREVAHLLL